MPSPRRPHKTLAGPLPLTISVLALLLALAAVFYVTIGGRSAENSPPAASSGVTDREAGTPAAPPSPSSPSSDPTSSAAPPSSSLTFAAPTGCLSHSSDPAQFLIDTQAAAPLTDTGAAEYAGAFARWISNVPIRDKERTLQTSAINPTQLRESIRPGVASSTATLKDAYGEVVEFKDGEAWVNVGLNWFMDGKRKGAAYYTIHLMPQSGHWRVSDINPPAQDDPAAIMAKMQPYKSGC